MMVMAGEGTRNSAAEQSQRMGVVSPRDTKEVRKLANRLNAERGGVTASAEGCIATTNLEKVPDVLLLCSAKCSFSMRRQP
jgi:hypothetical protein